MVLLYCDYTHYDVAMCDDDRWRIERPTSTFFFSFFLCVRVSFVRIAVIIIIVDYYIFGTVLLAGIHSPLFVL